MRVLGTILIFASVVLFWMLSNTFDQYYEAVYHMGTDKVHRIQTLVGFGAVLSAILGIIAFTKGGADSEERKSKTKKCPYCAEKIRVEAVVCRYCEREIE